MSRFCAWIKKQQALLLSFFVPLLLLLTAYAIFGIFPFGEKSVLVLDLAGQYVYFFEGLRDAVLGDKSLLYSFSRALGGEFLGIFAYYLASPFSFLVLLFPKLKITAAIVLILLLKTGSAGATFCFYLRGRIRRLPKALTVALSVAYALSGFAIAYQSNLMWMDALILLPLVVFGLERLIDRKGFLFYTVALALTFITNYYMGYMVALFCVLYFLYYTFSKEKIKRRELFRNATFFALFSVLSAFIAAFILLPAAYSLTFGKSDFATPTARSFLLVTLPELLKKLLPATYDTVMSDGAPFLYCGLFALLLLPLFFMSKHFSKRRKIAEALFLLILLLSMIFEPLDRVWHGFSAPNGLPCRYAFLFVFLLLRIAAFTLRAPRERQKKRVVAPLAISCGILLTGIILLKVLDPLLKPSPAFLPVALIALIATAVFLLLYLLQKNTFRWTGLFLSIAIIAEIGCNAIYSLHALHDDVTFTKQTTFDRESLALHSAAERLSALDNGFWRAESTNHLKSNDNLLAGLRGLSGSTSTLHTASINFLSQIGLPSRWHRSLYCSVNPLTDALLGVRYLLSDAEIAFYTPLFEENGLRAFENPDALSLVYGVANTAFLPTVNPAINCNRWLSALCGTETNAFLPLPEGSTLMGGCSAYTSADNTLVYLPKTADSTAFVTFTTTAVCAGDLFFTLPAPMTAPVQLYINEQYRGIHFDTSCSYMIYLGHFQAGEEVSVRMIMADHNRPIQIYKGENHFYLYHKAAASNALLTLSATQMRIADTSTDTHITGTLTTTASNQNMLFTVPTDRNWRVFIDGERIPTQEAFGALLSFTVATPGEHRVELRYVSPQLLIGSVISTLGVALLSGVCYLERKKHFFKSHTI
ncbi:MAG: hypothetical protein E7585_07105 [Ruminococcaceae bacterium]|nr:hypothetical protein [Oscillospiraceae bacterium]